MTYKVSRYTLSTVDSEGGALWYNSATGVRRSLTPDEARRAQAWAADPGALTRLVQGVSGPVSNADTDAGEGDTGKAVSPPSDAADDETLARELVKYGFFVDASRRETREVLSKLKRERQDQSHLGLTILPTLDCNLACPYCVIPVTQGVGSMSSRVQRQLVSWWREHLRGRSTCSVEWMGGEPLLYPETFWTLSGELLAVAKAEGVRLIRHAMATNGVCVTSELAEQLQSLGIDHIQVTLDGPEPYHNRSRPLASGGGSYQNVLAGLKAVAPVVQTQVRVNISGDNATAYEALLDALAEEGLADKIHVYPARVFEPEHRRGTLQAPILDQKAFGRISAQFALAAMARGFPPPRLPSPAVGGYCGAYRRSHFVVGPRGLLYACSAEVTASGEHAVGSIFSDTQTDAQKANQAFYDRYGPSKAKGCFDCPLLPICLGGCPEVARASEALDAGCVPWRFNLETQLVIEHEWMKLTKEAVWNIEKRSTSR